MKGVAHDAVVVYEFLLFFSSSEMYIWQSAQKEHIYSIPQAHKSPSFGFRIAGVLPRLFSNCAGRRGMRRELYYIPRAFQVDLNQNLFGWFSCDWKMGLACLAGRITRRLKASRCVQNNKYSQTACQYQISIKWLNLSLRRKTKTKQGWKKIDPGS